MQPARAPARTPQPLCKVHKRRPAVTDAAWAAPRCQGARCWALADALELPHSLFLPRPQPATPAELQYSADFIRRRLVVFVCIVVG